MTTEEKSKLIMELMSMQDREVCRNEKLLSKVDELLSLQKLSMVAESRLREEIQLRKDAQRQIEIL